MKHIFIILIILLIIKTITIQCSSPRGIDVSTKITDFSCLSDEIEYIIPRIYRSNGQVDTSAPDTIKAARNIGLDVSGYHFPDTSKDPKEQVDEAVNYLMEENVDIDMYWVDIEGSSWSSNCDENIEFIGSMIDQIKTYGYDVGIYTGTNSWPTITCDSDEFSSYKLWYARWYDNGNDPCDIPDDKKPTFGGWNEVYMHQYSGDTSLCSYNVDMDALCETS